MKYLLLAITCISCVFATAQTVQVVVPEGEVVKGTAFQVQYIITQPEEFITAVTPSFDSCRIVSGPNYYKGTAVINGKPQLIQNIAYTLVPLQSGVLHIGSLQAKFKQEEISSSVAMVRVIDPPNASYKASSSYTDVSLYAPSGNYEKMVDENLFIRTIVSKKICYVGEALVATFKLYSRLQSSSEALNAPSFYGFGVADMLPVNEAHTGVEVMNGKVYNTAILRKVQLFPVQAGRLVIDPMHVENKIEFDDTLQQRKVRLSKMLTSPAVTINVVPLPSQPDEFTGAVGKFSIAANVAKGTMHTNEEGLFVIRIRGSGNFIQFGEPQVQWPPGVEVLNVTSREALDKNTAPLTGSVEYLYQFAAAKPGAFVLPSVSFSYFDIQKKKFITIETNPLDLKVQPAASKAAQVHRQQEKSFFTWLILSLVIVLTGAFYYFYSRRKHKVKKAITPVAIAVLPVVDYVQQLRSIDVSEGDDKEACKKLQSILDAFCKEKSMLLSPAQKESLQSITTQINEILYSPFTTYKQAKPLIEKAVEICSVAA